ncbi:hypothetical protein IT774_07570 [Salinimonas marina]|uniref:Uncharacterized protein n=1 Tax=Salinimonas marina TaxID=2785918 RepID=A0A7S9DZT9_9ALTE|nr:hypothetical protein [Salinimonas marina]QPG06953.1 hypothetical protein IT774_07570 [Salinimonas marina]
MIDLDSYQRYVEKTFSKRNIKARILHDLTNDQSMIDLMERCADSLREWLRGDYYATKNQRLEELSKRDMLEVLQDILCVTATLTRDTEISSVVGQIVGSLKMDNKIHGITTAAELMGLITEFDFFDLYKEDEYGILMVRNNIELDEQTHTFIHETKFLPPMVVPPNTVEHNYDNALLTEKSAMILGKGTYHDGDICLDTINTFNRIPLCLNKRVLTSLSEVPKDPDMDVDVAKQWHTFVTASYRVYRDLIQTGNRFHLTHKVDMRGRTYAQGYHVSTQGNQFRKAICEFADKEVIEL